MAIGGAIEAGKAFVKFLLDDKEFESKLKSVGKRLQQVGAIGVAATAPLVAALVLATRVGVQQASAYADVAARAGVAADSLQRLAFVADENGVSLEAVAKNLKKFQQQLGDTGAGGKEFRKFLQGIGVDVAALKQLSPDEQIVEVGAAIAAYEDPARRAALASKAFGKSGDQMLPMLAKGADAFRRAARESDRLRATLSNDEVEVVDALGDAWGHSAKQLQGFAGHITAALAGPLTRILEWGQYWLAIVSDVVTAHPYLVVTFAAVVAVVFTVSSALLALGWAMHAYKIATEGAAAVTWAFNLAMVALERHPVIAVLSLIAAAVLGVAAYFGLASKGAGDFQAELDKIQPPQGFENSKLRGAALQQRLGGVDLRKAATPELATRSAASAPPQLSEEAKFLKLIEQHTGDSARIAKYGWLGGLVAGAF